VKRVYEKRVVKTCYFFFRSLVLLKYNILGFYFILKGKLFKSKSSLRTKRFIVKWGKLPLANRFFDIKFNSFSITTREGLYSFVFLLTLNR